MEAAAAASRVEEEANVNTNSFLFFKYFWN